MADGGASVERPWWRRPIGAEVLLNLGAIVVIPVVVRAVYSYIQAPLRGVGLAQLLDSFSGQGQFTDIGWEVSSARGLIDRGHSMYDAITSLAPLIDMSSYDLGTHTHPPTSAPLWLPLAFLPYNWWLPAFVIASISALAVSMRVLRVPAWVAYPLAILVALTPTGAFAMSTTYPLMALLLALAWRYRDRPWIAGPSYAVFAAARGVGGVMLFYPLLRRQWRTFAIGAGLGAAALALAVALEPDVISSFLHNGGETISGLVGSSGLYSPHAMLVRQGLPGWLAWVAALAVVAAGLMLRRELFWLLAWLTLALTPLGWAHSLVQATPIFVVMWQSGRLGKVLVLSGGVVGLGVLTTATVGVNMAWPLGLLIMALGVLLCPLHPGSDVNNPDVSDASPIPAGRSVIAGQS